ncbi:MAG: VOC family protein [Propionibacteriaceae bacterium]
MTSFAEAAQVVACAVAVARADADDHLWMDMRTDRVILSVRNRQLGYVTPFDVELVERLSATFHDRGWGCRPSATQMLEMAIDAMDAAAIRPFWKAVLDYVDELEPAGPTDPLVDPRDQGPAIWFQQMDAPRPQRNRIHLDLALPHDGAEARMAAALAAGGTLVNDAEARAFWVLADAEGNEVCLCTWQDRD